MSYSVEILNLGKRTVPGIQPATTTFEDEQEAANHHAMVLGEMVLRPTMVLLGAERRTGEEVRPDGIIAAARLTDSEEGGRVEILLRRQAEERPIP